MTTAPFDCRRCRERPAAQIGSSRSGYRWYWCSECIGAMEQRKKLRARYGITPADYARMLVRQGGVCAICGAPPPSGRVRRLHVDHDHASGKVRGLVCYHCNVGLAFIERLGARASAYLRRSRRAA